MRRLTVCPDADDNRILECADAAGADFLVTGNKRHFPAEWKRTSVVNGREFLERVFPRSAR
jgi:predicted nucleic acid-binding protein